MKKDQKEMGVSYLNVMDKRELVKIKDKFHTQKELHKAVKRKQEYDA